jgi:hypothetical protein
MRGFGSGAASFFGGIFKTLKQQQKINHIIKRVNGSEDFNERSCDQQVTADMTYPHYQFHL